MGGFWLLVGFFMLIGSIVGGRLKSIMNKYSKVPIRSGLSGADVAKAMLEDYGVQGVKITQGRGMLTDHYNPRTRTISLSPAIFQGRSIAAAAVAAHESGHAVQHATGYQWLKLRSNLVPVVSLSSKFYLVLIIAGIALNSMGLAGIGIALFGFTTVFALVTLPVEYDASNRALKWLDNTRVLGDREMQGAKTALKWAARTYVVAAIASAAQLLYWVAMMRR